MTSRWLDKTKSFLFDAPQSKVVAIDLESELLRIAVAEPHGDHPRVKSLDTIALPQELDLKDAAAVGAFIGQAVRKAAGNNARVVMDVPRSQVVLKTITLPAVPNAREIPAMVRFQVEKELPFPLDQAVIDFTVDHHFSAAPAGSAAAAVETKASDAAPASTIDVLVAAVQRSTVDYYHRLAEAAGVRLLRLGMRPYADLRCVEACLPQDQRLLNLLLVHIIGNEAEINVLIEGDLAFSRSAVLRHADDDGRPLTPDEVAQALVMEAGRTAQSALSAHRGRRIERIVIAGDTGLESPVASTLGDRLKVPADVFDPGQVLHVRKGAPSIGFTTPLGLAVAQGRAEPAPFDFLHPKEPPVERDLKRIRRNLAIAAAVAVVLGILIIGFAQRRAAENRLAALQTKLNDLNEQAKPVERLTRRVAAIDAWLRQSEGWLDHWAHLSALMPPADEAYLTSLRGNPDGSLVLVVKARSSRVITDLSHALRNAGYDVKLGSETVGNDEFGYRYLTSMRITPGPRMKIDVASLKAPARPEDDGSIELIRRRTRGSVPPAETQPTTPVSEPSPPSQPPAQPAAASDQPAGSEARPGDSRSSDARSSDPRNGDSRSSDPRSSSGGSSGRDFRDSRDSRSRFPERR